MNKELIQIMRDPKACYDSDCLAERGRAADALENTSEALREMMQIVLTNGQNPNPILKHYGFREVDLPGPVHDGPATDE